MIEVHFYAQHPQHEHAYSDVGNMSLPEIPQVGHFFFCNEVKEVSDPGTLRAEGGNYKISKISYELPDGHVACYGELHD